MLNINPDGTSLFFLFLYFFFFLFFFFSLDSLQGYREK